jgi:hypothetical protein
MEETTEAREKLTSTAEFRLSYSGPTAVQETRSTGLLQFCHILLPLLVFSAGREIILWT